ncbi:MAG: M23 family metallopeptidase [Methylovulum sp.]|nr:M23 family metallopeptidase [Methylovulum sp.]
MNKNTLSTFTVIVFACFSFSSIVFASGGKGLSDAVAIVPNSSLSLNFDTYSGYDDYDYFKVDLLIATDLTVKQSNYWANIEILDSEGNHITSSDYSNYDASAYLEQGSYYIKLHYSCSNSCSSNTQYNLSVSVNYAPFNISPIIEESLIDTRTPNYHWTMVDGATSYQLNITPNGFKNDYVIPVDITKYCNIQRGECQITPRDAYLPDATSVKWHITAKDSLNKDMVFSDNTNFTVSNSYTIEKPLANINSAQILGHCLFGSYCKRTKLTSAHNGVDFMTKSGTSVYAICDGVVKVVKPSSTSINNRFTVIEHTCTGINGKLYAYYGHINPESGVKAGDKVTKGKLIGKVGYFKDGQYDNSHLHLSLATKYFSSGWGYFDIGKTTLSDCEQSSVKTRRDSLIAKSWIDPTSFGSAVGWGTFFLKGGASGKCNAQTQNDFPYPVGNLLPYYPFK